VGKSRYWEKESIRVRKKVEKMKVMEQRMEAKKLEVDGKAGGKENMEGG